MSGDLRVVRRDERGAAAGPTRTGPPGRRLALLYLLRPRRSCRRRSGLALSLSIGLVRRSLVQVELEDVLVGVLVAGRVGVRVPLVVLDQDELLVRLNDSRPCRGRSTAVQAVVGGSWPCPAGPGRSPGRWPSSPSPGTAWNLMVMSWPSTVIAREVLAVGVGAVVVLAALEVGLGVPVPGPDGNVLGVERALDAEGDLLSGDGSPFSHLTSSLIVNVHSVKSSLGVPRSVARSGTSSVLAVSASWRYWVSDRNSEGLLDPVVGHRPQPVGSRLRRAVVGVGCEHRDGRRPPWRPRPRGRDPARPGPCHRRLSLPSEARLASPLSSSPPPPPQAASASRSVPRSRRQRAPCSVSCCPAFLSCVRDRGFAAIDVCGR